LAVCARKPAITLTRQIENTDVGYVGIAVSRDDRSRDDLEDRHDGDDEEEGPKEDFPCVLDREIYPETSGQDDKRRDPEGDRQ
jgi:hypothetical protein